MGGAQAIAALAYGTETIPRVDKITGPGNIFVALAKKACFGVTGIDSVAGPSEILVIADHTANPRYVAADLLSQAEHDPMASAILLTTDPQLAENVAVQIDQMIEELPRNDLLSQAEHDPMASAILLTTDPQLAEKVAVQIDQMIEELPRKEIICQSIDSYGYIFVGESIDDLIDAANVIASEHLEIITENPFEVMQKCRCYLPGKLFFGTPRRLLCRSQPYPADKRNSQILLPVGS